MDIYIQLFNGRWPTDHGFDKRCGPPQSYDEALWETDLWSELEQDPVSYMLEGKTGAKVVEKEILTYELNRNLGGEYQRHNMLLIEENAKNERPVFL